MQELKDCIRRYRDADNDIGVLNKTIYTLREKRKILELELGSILAQPQFAGYEKLGLEDDGSVIRIQRPNAWSKPWSLSKKDLQEGVSTYFASVQTPTAEGCIEFILQQQKLKLVATDFNFTRIVKNDE